MLFNRSLSAHEMSGLDVKAVMSGTYHLVVCQRKSVKAESKMQELQGSNPAVDMNC